MLLFMICKIVKFDLVTITTLIQVDHELFSLNTLSIINLFEEYYTTKTKPDLLIPLIHYTKELSGKPANLALMQGLSLASSGFLRK